MVCAEVATMIHSRILLGHDSLAFDSILCASGRWVSLFFLLKFPDVSGIDGERGPSQLLPGFRWSDGWCLCTRFFCLCLSHFTEVKSSALPRNLKQETTSHPITLFGLGVPSPSSFRRRMVAVPVLDLFCSRFA